MFWGSWAGMGRGMLLVSCFYFMVVCDGESVLMWLRIESMWNTDRLREAGETLCFFNRPPKSPRPEYHGILPVFQRLPYVAEI